MRTLIVVAFYYPPDNSSTGVLRTLKFTQYLGGLGWSSEVITVPTGLYVACDAALERQIPAHARVTRVWAPDLSKSLAVWGRYPSFAAYPDRYWPWLFGAVRAGMRIVRERKAKAIFATSPVPTALLIGVLLKRRTGLPLIIDFRDPWVDNATPPLRRFFEAKLERWFVHQADRIICNTPALRRDFLARYPEVSPDRIVVITNGYDEPDFTALDTMKPAAKFEIIYAGMLQKAHRNPDTLLRGLRLALDRQWLSLRDVKLSFLGTREWGLSEEFLGRLDELGLRGVTEISADRIGYHDALKRMASASILLVLLHGDGDGAIAEANQEWWGLTVPAKVYEYLRIGRPMLVLVNEGAVAELLRETGGGVPIPPQDVERIAAALRDLYNDWRAKKTNMRPEVPKVVRKYSRECLAGQLAAELQSICGP